MSLTDDNDAQLLFRIACELHGNYKGIFSPIDPSEESYYIERDKSPHKELEKLNFNTPVELRKYLEGLWGPEEENAMRKFISVVLAATFKRHPEKIDKSGTGKPQAAQKLPEFVYNF